MRDDQTHGFLIQAYYSWAIPRCWGWPTCFSSCSWHVEKWRWWGTIAFDNDNQPKTWNKSLILIYIDLIKTLSCGKKLCLLLLVNYIKYDLGWRWMTLDRRCMTGFKLSSCRGLPLGDLRWPLESSIWSWSLGLSWSCDAERYKGRKKGRFIMVYQFLMFFSQLFNPIILGKWGWFFGRTCQKMGRPCPSSSPGWNTWRIRLSSSTMSPRVAPRNARDNWERMGPKTEYASRILLWTSIPMSHIYIYINPS